MKVTKYIIKYDDRIYEYKNKRNYEHDLDTIFKGAETYESYDYITYPVEITLLNNKGVEFQKGFNNTHEANLFINKVVRGNKLKITLIQTLSNNILEEINYGR